MNHNEAVVFDLVDLVDDLVARVTDVRHALVLSTDGLMMAASRGMDRDHAEQLAAIAAGLNGLARSAGRHIGDTDIRRTTIELASGYLFVTAERHGSCVAVLCDHDIDLGLIGIEMEMTSVRTGQFVATAPAGWPLG